MKLFYLLIALTIAFPIQGTNVQTAIKSIENALPEVVSRRPRSSSVHSFEEAVQGVKISSKIAAGKGALKSGLSTTIANGRAHGTGVSRKYPSWAVTPSQKRILDMRQHEGWDVSLPQVIKNIRTEANSLDARKSNLRSREHNLGPNFIKEESDSWKPPSLPEPEVVPPFFFAKGTARGFDEAREYPSWVVTATQKRFLDRKQAEGYDVSLPSVIDDIKTSAKAFDVDAGRRRGKDPMHISLHRKTDKFDVHDILAAL
jgi:hypothetical protein